MTQSGKIGYNLNSSMYSSVKHYTLYIIHNIIHYSTTCSVPNRHLTVYIGEKKSNTRMLNNDLPQGSVPATILFNLCTKDLLPTTSKKLIYTDDIFLDSQNSIFEGLEEPLINELHKVDLYFKQWRLSRTQRKQK